MAEPPRHVWLSIWLLLALAACLISASPRNKNGHDDDDEEDRDAEDIFWDNVGGIVVIGVMSLVGAALFSLAAWIVCSCHERCTKGRISASSPVTVHAGKRNGSSHPPEWSRSLTIQPDLTVGFGIMSEGFLCLSNLQVLRQRPGTDVIDGAKWSAPMTTGKHLFEIIWPWGCRGYHASVGVATNDAPIKIKGGPCLVGGNAQTWGLDIVRRRVMHNKRSLGACPTDGSYVPDRFMMYIDTDEGTVGFGSEVTFWGYVITNLPKEKPLFLMVGAGKWEANIQIFYRGSAGPSGFDPYAAAGTSYALPPLRGQPMLPNYNDVFSVPVGEPVTSGTTSDTADRPKSAWEPVPPPTPIPSAPDYAPPPYASPTPQH